MLPALFPVAFSLLSLLGIDAAEAEKGLSRENLLTHLKLLASEDLEGRFTGSSGQRAAAFYVANRFRKAGLEPAGDRGGYLQKFTAKIRVPPRIGRGTKFSWKSSGSETLVEPRLMLPFGISAKGEVSAPVVFVGYAISSAALGYDDFAGIDVRGKIALCLRHSPGEAKPESPFGPLQMRVATFVNKAKAAAAAGAAGLILVNDFNHQEDDLFALAVTGEPAAIPFLQIRRDEAVKMFEACGKDLARLQREIDESLKPKSFALQGIDATMAADITPGIENEVLTENVIGLLRGSDPRLREEYVLVGAHMDHVGYGELGAQPKNRGQIHFGADDNASGTAALIELARAFSSMEPHPKRSMVFLAFSGEEVDLLGSMHYVKSPAFPLGKTTLMINLDMIGRSDNGYCKVYGLGTAEPLKSIVESCNRGIDLNLDPVLEVPGDSDHYPFAKAGVPVSFFFAGFHPDYHAPGDTWEKINSADASRIARLSFRLAREAANRDERLRFAGMVEGGK